MVKNIIPPTPGSRLQPLAATCSHLQPLEWPQVAACILFSSATTCTRLQPIEWPQVAARASGRKWPQVAARASGRKWPQVAARASGRKWPQVAARASGRKWPPLPKSNSCPSARSLKTHAFQYFPQTRLS